MFLGNKRTNYKVIDDEIEGDSSATHMDDEGPPHLTHELINVSYEGFQNEKEKIKQRQDHRWDHIENVDQASCFEFNS